MSRMIDDYIDLTVTSPPYDDLRDYKGYSFQFEEIAKELYRITKKGGIVVLIVNDSVKDGSETLTSFKQALYFKEVCGFKVHDTMIYEKDSISFPDKTRYSQIFEYMFVLSKGKFKTFNPIKDRLNKEYENKSSEYKKFIKGSYRTNNETKFHSSNTRKNLLEKFGTRFNIWRVSTGHNKSTLDEIAFKHPAIFPEKLVNDIILSWSNENDLVYDPFMGSGTTGKMALLNNRNFIGSEISEEYCKIANERIDNVRNRIF